MAGTWHSDQPDNATPPDKEFSVEEVVASGDADPQAVRQAIRAEVGRAKAGMRAAIVLVVVGLVLLILGITGTVNWGIKLPGGFSSTLENASPGVVCIVAAVVVIWITQPRITLGKSQKDNKTGRG